MEISFGELAVLASVGNGAKQRSALAYDAARLYQSTKFSPEIALVDIKSLEDRRFLAKTKTGLLELTRDGWAAVLHAIPVVENLRAAVAGVSYGSRIR